MDLDLTDPIAVMLAASDAFQRAGLDALAYGGLVLAMYGQPRETEDADLAVASVSVAAAHAALITNGLQVVTAFSDLKFGGCWISRLTLLGGGALNTVDLVRPRSERYAITTCSADIKRSLPELFFAGAPSLGSKAIASSTFELGRENMLRRRAIDSPPGVDRFDLATCAALNDDRPRVSRDLVARSF